MFTPQMLEKIPIELEKIFGELEISIMLDIVRRIKKAGRITRTADYQISRLHELGVSKKLIKKYIQETLELSEKEINHIYRDVIKAGYANDEKLYKATGKTFIKFEDNNELQQMISSIQQQTNNKLYNITNSIGFIQNIDGQNRFTPLAQYYQDVLDKNVSGILSGAFDYNTAIKNAVNEMTKSGLRTIDYASGRSYRIESAVRTALMTGVNQVTSKISNLNAEKLETDFFEVTAHGTARPTHQKWQGKVYSKEELKSICGLDTAEGLCGVNCRHHYYPFIPGVSIRAYSDEELQALAKKENAPIKYGDKEYTAYEAAQEQRKMERLLRKERQDIKLLKEGEANNEDIITAQAKYRILSDEYVKFSKAMDIPQQRERINSDGLKGNFAGGKEAEEKAAEEKADEIVNGNNDEFIGDMFKSKKEKAIIKKEAFELLPKKFIDDFSNINIKNTNEDRSYYSDKHNNIYLGKNADKYVLIHELGHAYAKKYDLYNNNEFLSLLDSKFSLYKENDFDIVKRANDSYYVLRDYSRFVSKYQTRIYKKFDSFENGKPNIKLAREYFSEGISYYYKNRNLLMNKDMGLFIFIDKIMRGYEKNG